MAPAPAARADEASGSGPSGEEETGSRSQEPSRARPGRLSRSADFERAYRRGRSVANRHFVLHAFPRSAGHDGPRTGVSVGKRVGGAVARNRAKRLLREAFRSEAELLRDGHDYVAVARADAAGLAEREGLEGVRRELRELLERAPL